MSTFYNPVKLNAGLKAVDTLPVELASFGVHRPVFLISPSGREAGAEKLLRRAMTGGELVLLDVPKYAEHQDLLNDLLDAVRGEAADSLVAVGGENVMNAARSVAGSFQQANGTNKSLPLIFLPCGEYAGRGVRLRGDTESTDSGPEVESVLVILEPELFRKTSRKGARGDVFSSFHFQVENDPEAEGLPHGRLWLRAARNVGALADRECVKGQQRYLRALSGVLAEMSGMEATAENRVKNHAAGPVGDPTEEPEGTLGEPRPLPDYFEFSGRGMIVGGEDALLEYVQVLRRMGVKRPMLLSDRGVEAAGLTAEVEDVLWKDIPPIIVDSDIPSDSDSMVVNRLAGLYGKNDCDVIVAVGGGSVMDTAKGVNILAGTGGRRLSDFAGAGKVARQLPPLVAIPTTSGTGSEVTLVAVIADHQQGKKLPYTSVFLQPDLAVLDPSMTASLPPFLTAATGMDALTHAMEAYYGLAHNPPADEHALEAVRLIGRYLLRVVEDPEDREGRLALAVASNLAGLAFSNSMVGMVHMLGHSVGAVCGVHHGVCMSILLPYGIEYNLHRIPDATGPLLKALTGEDQPDHLESRDSGRALAGEVRKMNEKLHHLTGGRHPRTLSEVKGREGELLVREDDLSRIADTAMGDASVLYNPEELDFDDALRVLQAAYHGESLKG